MMVTNVQRLIHVRSLISSLFPVGYGSFSGTVEDTGMDSRSDYVHHGARG